MVRHLTFCYLIHFLFHFEIIAYFGSAVATVHVCKTTLLFQTKQINVEIVDHNPWKVCHTGAIFKITMYAIVAIM